MKAEAGNAGSFPDLPSRLHLQRGKDGKSLVYSRGMG
jgi:hypothetical protein